MNDQANQEPITKIRVCWRKHGRIRQSTIQNKIKEATSEESQNVKDAIARAFEREDAEIRFSDDDYDSIVLYDEQQSIIENLVTLNSANITACGKKLFFVCFLFDVML